MVTAMILLSSRCLQVVGDRDLFTNIQNPRQMLSGALQSVQERREGSIYRGDWEKLHEGIGIQVGREVLRVSRGSEIAQGRASKCRYW